jgi:hypothetical protein
MKGMNYMFLFYLQKNYITGFFTFFFDFNRTENIFVWGYINVPQENNYNNYEMKLKQRVNIITPIFN